jgi:hypothetical protein
MATGGVGNPESWNRYAYVHGDSLNNRDSSGLFIDATDSESYMDMACTFAIPHTAFASNPLMWWDQHCGYGAFSGERVFTLKLTPKELREIQGETNAEIAQSHISTAVSDVENALKNPECAALFYGSGLTATDLWGTGFCNGNRFPFMLAVKRIEELTYRSRGE